MRYLATVPLGSRHITRDLMTLNPLEERAEEIKRTIADAHPEDSRRQAVPEEMDNSKIRKIVVARASEIIANITAQIGYAGMTTSELPGGIVIVGGGAMLKGFAEALAHTSGMSVRRGSLPTTVRLVGNKISTSEDLDVISLLNYLAHSDNVRPCTVTPRPDPKPEPEPVEEPVEETDDNDPLEGIEPRKSNFWGKLKQTITGLGTPNAIDDFDD